MMVTAFIPLRERDIVVGDLEIRIRPIHDEAFADDLACDVFFVGADEKQYAFTDLRAREVLAEIKREHPATWREIREAAEHNYKGRG
ncbi:hypothetical protein [Taklimakanibacter deserti]|uniref:hypothetical protein n=1 Tax=Taklimakanibacter deserti TaxID=2267839 RepID=UPI000E656483